MKALAVSLLPGSGRGATRSAAGEGRFLLAGLFSLAGFSCGYLALRLESAVARFDTLSFLLADPEGSLARVREGLLLTGACLALLAILALVSWRLATGGLGLALLALGGLAAPLSRTFLAEQSGLEEGLLYRVRGLADIGLVGGIFLLFLAMLPGILLAPPGAFESAIRRLVSGASRAWANKSPMARMSLIAGAALVATLAVGRGVLRDFPNSSDENSYLTQARIFASGRLWVPAPPHPEFFRARSFVMDSEQGRFFAKAFPGWAALLSLGVLAGVPWLVNPLLSAVTLVVLGWLAVQLLGPEAELPTLGLMAVTPFFLFNAASYFNHPLTLFLMTLFLAAVVQIERGKGDQWALAAGATAGAAFTVRPASALLLTAPFLLYLTWHAIQSRRWRSLIGLLLPVGLFAALIGTYNRILFGSSLKTGYAAYDPGDIRAGFGADNFAVTGWWIIKLLLWTLPGSLAGLYLLARGRKLSEWVRQEPLLALMAVALALQAGGHLIFQNKGSNEYGPRYYYDGWVFLTLLMTAGWMRALESPGRGKGHGGTRRGLALGGAMAVVLTVTLTIPLLAFHYRDKVDHNRDIYTRVESTGLHAALVFLKTGSGRMPPGDLVRNSLDFRTGFVYVRDLGQESRRQLIALYPDRPALVYAYDSHTRSSHLAPAESEGTP
ncbi:MAG: glycosyltransferase family 39 protein [Acidobacteria bacterium]|nr:glycosyltransferase family 39 protein [Acidobacteriota bacterium]